MKPATRHAVDGILVVDKPLGPTSHDIVAKIRYGLGIEKVGHTGTLDPLASGVLPLVLGRGTKLARYLSGSEKAYRATLKLGVTTSTLDAEGEELTRVAVAVDEAQVAEVLAQFRGTISQVPPMYSAKKIEGKKLYQLARKGVEIAREAKTVTITRLNEVVLNGDELTFEVACSAGTYVRVLAQDIGTQLGCGAYLKSLRRLSAGPFTLEHAIALEDALGDPEAAIKRVLPLDHALGGLPRLDVDPQLRQMVVSGHQLSVAELRGLDTPSFAQDDAVALALMGGDIFAVARAQVASEELPGCRRERPALKTERVLSRADG